MDEDKNGFIDKKELVKGMLKIYFSHLESRFHLVFNMYDFNSDGKICKDDILLMLSHIPISTVFSYIFKIYYRVRDYLKVLALLLNISVIISIIILLE